MESGTISLIKSPRGSRLVLQVFQLKVSNDTLDCRRLDETTFVSITSSGFHGTPEEVAQQAIDATEGFTFVLAGLKALLEHNINLNLIADRFPG